MSSETGKTDSFLMTWSSLKGPTSQHHHNGNQRGHIQTIPPWNSPGCFQDLKIEVSRQISLCSSQVFLNISCFLECPSPDSVFFHLSLRAHIWDFHWKISCMLLEAVPQNFNPRGLESSSLHFSLPHHYLSISVFYHQCRNLKDTSVVA
jgi:hypothetical protein